MNYWRVKVVRAVAGFTGTCFSIRAHNSTFGLPQVGLMSTTPAQSEAAINSTDAEAGWFESTLHAISSWVILSIISRVNEK